MKYLFILVAVFLLPDIALGTDYRTGIVWFTTQHSVSRHYYEERDTIYLEEGALYKAPFYLYLPDVISGVREIRIDYMPEYLNDDMSFNADGGGFRLDWYSGFYTDAVINTRVYKDSFRSNWQYVNKETFFWLGDFSFTNSLKAGDSLVYTVTVNAIRSTGANHHFYHTRKIICKSAVVTDIEDYSSKDLKVTAFPNPCQGMLTIRSQDYYLAKFVDMSGRLLKQIELNPGENMIDISNFKPGIYFLKLNDETLKIVKK